MKIYLTATNGANTYTVTRLIEVPTAGDLFKQLFMHHESWSPELSLYFWPAPYTEPALSLGTLQSLFEMPLIELCRKISPYYSVNRLRADRVAIAANLPTIAHFRMAYDDIEPATDFWR